jgi:hypothetical protein
LDLNDIKYGTIPIFHVESIKTGSAIIKKCEDNGIIDHMLNNPPPTNDSDETKNELLELQTLTKNASEDDYKLCDVLEHKHYDFFAKFCNKLGLTDETETSIKALSEEFDGLVNYIKFKINRPRPHQLAIYYDIPLFPIVSTDANSPSWPSGHSVDFLIILHRLKQKYPNNVSDFDLLYTKIKDVRQLSGVHYPSDKDGADTLVTMLIENNLI